VPTLVQFKTEVEQRLQDVGAKLKTEALDGAIRQAILQRYSKDRPQEKVSDVSGNGTALLAVPTGWEDGFSRLVKEEGIEYPVGSVPPTYLEDDQWRMYRDTAAPKIMLLSAQPAASETIRLKWTQRHAEDASTVRIEDFEALSDYAAALAFDLLAARHVPTGDATLAADTVNYRTKPQEYLGLAKKFAARYFTHMGIDPEAKAEAGPALAIGEVDQDIAGSGVDRLTHPGRWR